MKNAFKLTALLLAFWVAFSGCSTFVGQTETTTIITEEQNESADASSKRTSASSANKPSSSKKPASGSVSSVLSVTGTQITLSEKEPVSSSPASSEKDPEVQAESRPAYKALNAKQRKVYAVIKDMAENLTEGLVSVPTDSEADITLAYKAVNYDYPEYFWMPFNYIFALKDNSYMIAMKYSGSEYSVDYLYPKSRIETMTKSIERKTEEVLEIIEETDTDYEKELKIHDFLCDSVVYPSDFDESYYYNIYGALVMKKSVCEGYARTMQYLCTKIGIECVLVTGSSKNEGHMWNQIKLDGNWYNLDLTWDDADGSEPIWHTYFNFNDKYAALSHEFDPIFTALSKEDIAGDDVQFNIIKNKCTSDDLSYYKVNDILLTGDPENNRFAAASAFLKAFNSGAGYVDFQIAEDVFLGGTKINEMFDFFHLETPFVQANQIVAAAGLGPFRKTIATRNGRGFRVYYE